MNYNTSKSQMKFREYGRYVQELVDYCKTIENDAERQAYAERVVDYMLLLTPTPRNMEDHLIKLWTHFFHMANYEINVQSPMEVFPYERQIRPNKLPYPKRQNKYRHYGRYIFDILEEARKMEDPEKKKVFLEVIGAFMKMSYTTWNRDTVTDDIIDSDLQELSKGTLFLPPNADIDTLVAPSKKSKYQSTTFQKAPVTASITGGNKINSQLLGPAVPLYKKKKKKKKKRPGQL